MVKGGTMPTRQRKDKILKRIIYLILLLLITAQAITIQRDTLKNGLVVLSVEAHKIPMVEMRILIRAGSVYDPAQQEGLAYILNQLLLRRSERSKEAPLDMIEYVGGELSPLIGEDYAGFSARILSKDLSLLIKVVGDILTNPVFDTLEFNRLKKETISRLKANMDDPYYLGMVNFRKYLFAGSPLNHLPEGFDSTIKGITLDAVKNFFKKYYIPNNTFFVFVGDFSRDSLLKILGNEFEKWPKGGRPNLNIESPRPPAGKNGYIIKRDISQAYIFLGFLGPNLSAPDWLQIRLMNYILGGSGLISRITNEIREKRGLAYSAYSYFERFHNGGYFVCEVQTKNESANEVVQIIINELKRMQIEISEDELTSAKKYYTGHLPLEFDTYRKMANFIAEIEKAKLGLDYLERFEGLISHITLAEVKEAAIKYLHPEDFCLVIVGDLKEDDLKFEDINWIR
ncbi:MAG: pitrilysin family protein [candidate division WOR-3 bacterium]